MKKYFVKTSRGVVVLATNNYQKAIDKWLWDNECIEILVFDEQGNYIRTISQLKDI